MVIEIARGVLDDEVVARGRDGQQRDNQNFHRDAKW